MNPKNQMPLDAIVLPSTRPANVRRQPYSMTYTLLLALTTGVAAVFCYLYLSKPLVQIITAPKLSVPQPEAVTDSASAVRNEAGTEPAKSSIAATPKAPIHGTMEETNLRVQHVLTAESSDGRVDRIELTVPVLYQSRTLLWSEHQVETARLLQKKLSIHRAQTQELREEGRLLLAAWNELIKASMPEKILRADSPSLPSNQRGTANHVEQDSWTSKDLIEIKSKEP